MKNKVYISLEKEKVLINQKIKTNNSEILELEKTIKALKRKNSKLQTKVADINGKQLKMLNGGKELPVYLDITKGMI